MYAPVRWIKNILKPEKRTLSPETMDFLLGETFNAGSTYTWEDIFGNLHPRELSSNAKNHLGLSAIYCALNMYLGAMISLPRFVQRIESGSGRPLRFVATTEHPASRIWSHYANEELSSDDLMKLVVYDVLFQDGNFYAFPVYQAGRIHSIHYIHPSRIPRGNIFRSDGTHVFSDTRKKAKPGQLVYKVLMGTTQEAGPDETLFLSASSIIHIKGLIPDPEHNRSQGILENAARSAGLYDSAEQMGSNFYKRGYTSQMFLSTDKVLNPKVREDLEALMNNTQSSGMPIEDMFKTRILEHGLKPIHVGLPMQQIQFIETRAFSIEDVGRWWNVPPSLLHSIMGVKSSPENYDQLMVIWIQNGLGHFLSNVASQFRDQLLSRQSQPLYRFDYQRLHLYKTVLNDFSQALRNLFEIGGINRLDLAEFLGIYLDPADPTNTQRYVPANIITVDHSLALEKKANKSLKLMEEQILSAVQDRELSKASHEKLMEAPEAGASPDDPSGSLKIPSSPGESKNDPDKGTSRGEGMAPEQEDKSKRAASARTPDNLVRQALYNVLNGLHLYELRVLAQKQKSRPGELTNAMEEWYPRFQQRLRDSLTPWDSILTENSLNLEAIISSWPSNSRQSLQSEDPSSSLKETFTTTYSFLTGEQSDDSGSEHQES